ncbi:MAG: NgoFVII family restriction endonuclease [Kofleriaceae bacterium]|nr:MAG: NgoFVII family restriction endonuclease [Kofleriaceae bacterium]
MPRIFDNIDRALLPALRETLAVSDRADFCVGYFNLRGWKRIDDYVERWAGGDGQCCRLLVGMQRVAEDELRAAFAVGAPAVEIDNQSALHLKKKLAEEFRQQLMIGAPTNQDEAGLRRLVGQLRAGKLVVKLFLRHPLHAKLYVMFRPDPITPAVAYLGSSNLTQAGLSSQGELNVDVVDGDACEKLARWFEERWDDRWCVDISNELADIVDQSWARGTPLSPYHIYIKMAYHLSEEARHGLIEFRIPDDFEDTLFDFQIAAVKIAAHHLNKRGGVLIGDVVGLGKTLMATALARIFEDDHDIETLIICPRNLVGMWEDHRSQYRLRGRVMAITEVMSELPTLRRYRLVLIDESHNLRNRDGKRYRAIQEYIRKNESKVVLLSATPYNKTYADLGNQLRLFLAEDRDLGIRPERLLGALGETEFLRRFQCPIRSLAAFEKSEYADDWRELMRLYMVRRTRTFIQDNYAHIDPGTGRRYLTFGDGRRSYFPVRSPKTVKFKIDDGNPNDQYARLYADPVVEAISQLALPRYGLGNYLDAQPGSPPTSVEASVIADLGRAGKRLMGFCRTNLFKRLESSGHAFLKSVERHILRNFIYLHALDTNRPIPIGAQDAALLDSGVVDRDDELFADGDDGPSPETDVGGLRTEADFHARAAATYQQYAGPLKRRFQWIRADRFQAQLATDLRADATALLSVVAQCGAWRPDRDAKLKKLFELITKKHAGQKILVFTQFADTVDYLHQQLAARGVGRIMGVTGDTEDPTQLAWRFSPNSNRRRDRIGAGDELDVLIATDVLSEGQNLQDAAIVVNYDLPWAIVRLVQRAGRIDRIGQQAEAILCYSFLPAEGVERVIRLRARVRRRLRENAEVVGTDEAFFEGERAVQSIRDLFTEKAGILDGDADTDVDLGSYAFQIWKNATDRDPALARTIPDLPNVVFSTKPHSVSRDQPEGVLVYVRTPEDNDALAWVDLSGKSITESQFAILKAAECAPSTIALARHDHHHDLVRQATEHVASHEKTLGGQLGRPSGARFRTYERLKRYADSVQGTLFDTMTLRRTIEDVYNFPLQAAAIDSLNRLLKTGASDQTIAERAMELREEAHLCIVHDDLERHEPRIICSLGLKKD